MTAERTGTVGAALRAAAIGYALGCLPFSGWLARVARGVDLRDVETGTVSGTGLYRVAGWKLLFVGGALDVAKGIVAVLLVDRDHPRARDAAVLAVVAGHNWSPLLRGAGGRGISPALGATAVHVPEATVALGAGLAAGKLSGRTGLGSFVAQASLPLVLARRARPGRALGIGLIAVMWAKRILGNRPPSQPSSGVYLRRLLFDHD